MTSEDQSTFEFVIACVAAAALTLTYLAGSEPWRPALELFK